MTSNAEIAKAMAEKYDTRGGAVVRQKAAAAGQGCHHRHHQRSFGGCCSRHISVTRS